ncbi:DUF6480 family protein [Streptomyces hydrogenans]
MRDGIVLLRDDHRTEEAREDAPGSPLDLPGADERRGPAHRRPPAPRGPRGSAPEGDGHHDHTEQSRPGTPRHPRGPHPRSRRRGPPGETPPAESGTGTGTGPYRPLRRGWAAGPLLIVGLLVMAFALFFLVYAIVLATG